MSHRPVVCLAALLFAVAFVTAGRAQDNSATSSTQAPAQPAGASGQVAQSSSQAAAPAAPSTKKVWTNDDVTDLRDNSAISTVGGSNAKSGRPAANRQAATSKRGDPNWYRDQIAKLQAQLPPLDRQIAQLQDAIDGTPTGDSKTSTRPTGVRGGDWRTELIQLQTKRDSIAAHITALQDEARHNGVPANALP
jgi:hypothetical protein